MPKMTGSISVSEIMEVLHLDALPDSCSYRAGDNIELNVAVDQRDIDDEATEEEPETIDPDLNDLQEGLEALRAGNVAMARILLDRAFEAHDDGVRQVVEAALRPRQDRHAA